ncbi:hypothetical protein ID017_10445 [Pseudomonas aeruginosa]|uniref:hypothetical protein n=1 Tax=Pseudomonas aeruginosa TaxID=287 RepID=UPI001ADB519B|nr:hypothetical protein [Pseudomonas aeruginosa]MBO8409701.1 hypothetical protein [Pseudomonas aeruginosa]
MLHRHSQHCLNYDVLEDETLYEGLTLSDWMMAFVSQKSFAALFYPKTLKNH